VDTILRKFPNLDPRPDVIGGDGMHFHVSDGRRILDFTAGITGGAVLGYSHPQIVAAMKAQLGRINHIGYGVWSDPTHRDLADLLVSKAPDGLDKVYFAGLSGSEAVEAAMKLSFQVHHDSGDTEKSWFISRKSGYHGATLQAMAVSDIPLFDIFQPLGPERIRHIAAHNPAHEMSGNQSLDDYARRGAQELEDALVEIGPERVCAFIGETMLGAAAGYVPPAPGYWRYVREVCQRHNVHLILDEVFCGLGRAGSLHCCEIDEVTPDFLCVGKTLGAGYAPLSLVLCNHAIEAVIAAGPSQRIHHGHTYQGHALGAAAALAVQKIVHSADMQAHTTEMADYLRSRIDECLSNDSRLGRMRGRGLLVAMDYNASCGAGFGEKLQQVLEEDHHIQVNARGSGLTISPAYIVSRGDIDRLAEALPAAMEKAS